MPMPTPFNNLITFSRGSNATVTGPNGLIQYAPNNLVTNSESFDAAAWVKAAATVSANVTASPEGTTTADKIVETATTAPHAVYQVFTYGTGLVYAATVYAKKAERNWIYVGADTAAAEAVFFDLDNGTVGSQGTGYVGSITDAGNGWYRCTVIITQSTALPPNFLVVGLASANGTFSYAGNGTSGAFIWGAQLELGSTATTYNPTTVKNLLGFSEAFDNAAWTKTRASIVTGAQANPINGLFNAQKLMEDTTASNTHLVALSSGTVGSSETLSAYVKNAGRQWIALQIGSSTSAYFNIGTGVLGTVTNGTASIIDIGSGWYRCALSATRVGTTNNFLYLASANGTVSYTGDGNSGVYIYGAQLSDSASLDPYVPTPGAAPSSTAFYGPRFDFDPVTLQPRGILIEEQRTNLLLNSVFGGAVSGTPGTAPTSWGSFANGSIVVTSLGRNFAANSIRITTTSARHFYSQTVALAATGTWIITFKVNVGAAVRIDELLAFNTRPAGSTIQYFYNDAAQAASFVPPTGSGVLQVAVTTTGTSGNAEIRFGCGASNAVTADVTFWDAQWELGTFATSYIPTVASTVTRSADVATITGQNFAQWYRQDEGAFVALFDSYLVDTSTRNALSAYAVGATSNNILFINAVQRQFQINNAGNQADLDGGTPTSGAIIKAAGAYRLNDFALSLDAGSVVTDTVGTVPTVDALGIGISSLSLTPVNGHIRNIRFIPARAADFQLQGLTT